VRPSTGVPLFPSHPSFPDPLTHQSRDNDPWLTASIQLRLHVCPAFEKVFHLSYLPCPTFAEDLAIAKHPASWYRHVDPLASLFQFVDAQGGGGQLPGSYSLVTQFPRRQFLDSYHGTLQEAGFGGQEALLLEPLERS